MVLFDPASLLFLAVPLFGAFLSGRGANAPATTIDTVVLPIGIGGTLIGLIHMLHDLDDPSAIGPAMAVALLPALYAAIVKLGLDVYISGHQPQRDKPSPALSAPAVLLWVGIIIAAAIIGTGHLVALLSLEAMGATVVSIVCILGLTSAAGSEAHVDRLARYLPYAGLLIFLAGVIGVLHAMNDPSAIGPYMAMSLLGLLYTTAISVGLKLVRPDLVAVEPPTSQWLFWSAALAGVGGSLSMVLLSVSAAS